MTEITPCGPCGAAAAADETPCPDPSKIGTVLFGQNAVDTGTHRPLLGGWKITAMANPKIPGTMQPGSIGCLMQDPDHPDVGYILTVEHLLGKIKPAKLADLKGKLKVGQPDGSDSTCGGDIVGVWLDGVLEDVNELRPNGTRSNGADECLVKLLPGTVWKAEIADMGPVRGVHNVTAAERDSGTYQVMKRGHATGKSGGVIVRAGDSTKENPMSSDVRLVIKPNGDRQGSERAIFANEGDSGSVVLNANCEVIGLLYGVSPFGHGYVRPIQQVLDHIATIANVRVATVPIGTASNPHTVPGGSTIAIPEELAVRLDADPGLRADFLGADGRAPVGRPWFTDVPVPADRLVRLRADLEGSAAGRFLMRFWSRNREELSRLLTEDRRLMLVWQRGGGAALIQLLFRMVSHPGEPLPETLHGEPLMACLEKAYAEFRRCASPDLRADLERVRALLPDLAGLDYRKIIDALGMASHV